MTSERCGTVYLQQVFHCCNGIHLMSWEWYKDDKLALLARFVPWDVALRLDDREF